MLYVSHRIAIPDDELQFRFIRASGPGGQKVNKVATAVQLRFNVRRSPSLPPAVAARLERMAGRRMTSEGDLVIDARRYRTRERNRQDALERLVALIRRAEVAPRPRKKTRPPPKAKEQRLREKRRRGERKRGRRPVEPDTS